MIVDNIKEDAYESGGVFMILENLDFVWMIGLGFLVFMLVIAAIVVFKPGILDKLLP